MQAQDSGNPRHPTAREHPTRQSTALQQYAGTSLVYYAGEARHCFVAGEDTSPSAPVVAFVPLPAHHSDSVGATVA